MASRSGINLRLWMNKLAMVTRLMSAQVLFYNNKEKGRGIILYQVSEDRSKGLRAYLQSESAHTEWEACAWTIAEYLQE